MMNLKRITNNHGVTLAELIIAMAISSIVLLIMVSGSLFVQRYVNEWKHQEVLAEELDFVHSTFEAIVTQSKEVSIVGDSIICEMDHGRIQRVSWAEGLLTRNGTPLIRAGLRLDRVSLNRTLLPTEPRDSILNRSAIDVRSPWWELSLVISDEYGKTDSLRCLIRNEPTYYKYAKK